MPIRLSVLAKVQGANWPVSRTLPVEYPTCQLPEGLLMNDSVVDSHTGRLSVIPGLQFVAEITIANIEIYKHIFFTGNKYVPKCCL